MNNDTILIECHPDKLVCHNDAKDYPRVEGEDIEGLIGRFWESDQPEPPLVTLRQVLSPASPVPNQGRIIIVASRVTP